MEENIQRVFAILISIIIFFIFPLYISYEKKDDVSYALALKITTEFVNNVKNNGYISYDMYTKFVSDLGATNNMYDIKFEHKSYEYYPVIYAYEDNTYSEAIKSFDYSLYKNEYEAKRIKDIDNKVYTFLKCEYRAVEKVFTEKQILEAIDRGNSKILTSTSNQDYINYNINDIPIEPNIYAIKKPPADGKENNSAIYTLNEGDEFNVVIKNINITTAEMLFNSFTFSMTGNTIPRVYVNYGGIVAAEKYKQTVID